MRLESPLHQPLLSLLARANMAWARSSRASHNPAPDNGIKFVGHDGKKTTDEMEYEIEQMLDTPIENRPTGPDIGELITGMVGLDRYMAFLESMVPERLEGIKVAVDAAHGAAYLLGPEILRRLGAEIVVVGNEPNGNNINAEGGATKPEFVQAFTTKNGCDVGVAFDGDADRAVFF